MGTHALLSPLSRTSLLKPSGEETEKQKKMQMDMCDCSSLTESHCSFVSVPPLLPLVSLEAVHISARSHLSAAALPAPSG